MASSDAAGAPESRPTLAALISIKAAVDEKREATIQQFLKENRRKLDASQRKLRDAFAAYKGPPHPGVPVPPPPGEKPPTIRLPEAPQNPPYVSWVHTTKPSSSTPIPFLRNRKWSDPEQPKKVGHEGTEKREEGEEHFTRVDDEVIWRAFHEVGRTMSVKEHLSRLLQKEEYRIDMRYEELKDGTASTWYEVPGGASEPLPTEDDGVGEWRAWPNLKEACDTITRLFCKQCLLFDCRTHDILPSPEPYDLPPPQHLPPLPEPCGAACIRHVAEGMLEGGEVAGEEWSAFETELFARGRQMFGADSCRISDILLRELRTCTEVSARLKKTEALKEALPRVRSTGRGRKASKRKRRVVRGGDRVHREPCECTEACEVGSCSCPDNCTKHCACRGLCKQLRAISCACRSACGPQCPCVDAARECDPDLCKNCQLGCGDGSIPGAPSLTANANGCNNMKIREGKRKRILLGRSAVQGWGAFAKDVMEKGDFLGEYTGEIVDQTVAESRGLLYDRKDRSFLFTVNDVCVIDAEHMGNKLKFANHSSTPNAEAKVLLVGSDHRIGIHASKRIEAGEEIFYDYGYNKGAQPDWWEKKKEEEKK